MKNSKIIIPGGAGLVGQNLITQLKIRGYTNLWVVDKHSENMETLRELHPDVNAYDTDLSVKGPWTKYFEDATAVVMLQAQIGGVREADFIANNIDSTRHILEIIKTHGIPKLVHISSSVVNSEVDDFYSLSKRKQEDLVLNSGISCPILRPTLMFGWFDRKHLGWLARFMAKFPIFPMPGNGEYMRQPLYVGDFCKVIISCIESKVIDGIYNISGQEKLNYIDIIREIRRVTKARMVIFHLPYALFYSLLAIWSFFDKNPPFTTQQLRALVVKEEFEIIDWPIIFSITATPFSEAVSETFCHPIYSNVEMEF